MRKSCFGCTASFCNIAGVAPRYVRSPTDKLVSKENEPVIMRLGHGYVFACLGMLLSLNCLHSTRAKLLTAGV